MDQTPEDINFVTQARGQKFRDDWDAYMVESLRHLGRTTGQVRHYERKAQEYLDRNGYSDDANDDIDGM